MLTTSAPTEKERMMATMDEYIEKGAAIAAIMSEPPDAHYPHWYADKIKSIPAADVEPVRHGRWIMGTGENGLQTGHRECSRCGEIVKYGYSLYGVHNFCNYCGAKMDGDDVNG